MKDWIGPLLALQEVDMRIENLGIRLGLLPREEQKLAKELKIHHQALDAAREEYKKTELAIKQVESAISKFNEHINRLQQQSAMIKKNTEYQAMMNEIKQLKDNIGEEETKEINLLDQLEEQKSRYREQEKQFAAEQSNVNDEIAEMRQSRRDVEAEIEQLRGSRKELEAKVDATSLGVYNRLLKATGVPMARITPSGICGHCHLKVTPQTHTSAKKRDLVCCDNCSHLIYLDN